MSSRRPITHICVGKPCFQERREAEAVVARWVAMGTLRYAVNIYCCPMTHDHYHIGRARRGVRRS
jgi:hypothetical protein